MMELGAEGVFVGSGIFKSGDPAKRAAAIVKATANWQDADLLAKLSENLAKPWSVSTRTRFRPSCRSRRVTGVEAGEDNMVVAVEYISKEESADAETATHGVTGILAVQGAFAEHAAVLDKLGAPWKLLRAAEDFDESIDRVILPGGESTTQGKLLRSTGLFEPIAAHIKAGKPVLGTCAGMILLAKKLDNDENVYFGALDAVVRRNAYGRQLGSFQAIADFGQADDPQRIADFPLVFIRGPYVVSVGPEATVETEVDGHVVGLRQGNILATAFHPELTDDVRIHELFLSL